MERRVLLQERWVGSLIQYGSQIFKMNIVMTAIALLDRVIVNVSRHLVAGSGSDAPPLAPVVIDPLGGLAQRT